MTTDPSPVPRAVRPIDVEHDQLMARAEAEHQARVAADRAHEAAARARVLHDAAVFVEAMNEGCGRKLCGACTTREDVADALRDTARRLAAEEQPTETQTQREPDPDCERCDGSGLDPDAYFVDRERQIWTHAPCSECLPEDDAPEPVERVKHSGPDTKFCVLCLSGEHERVDDAARPAVAGQPDHLPRRGDTIDTWLKTQRDDRRDDDRGQWTVLDQLLDLYRLHADTNTPLAEQPDTQTREADRA